MLGRLARLCFIWFALNSATVNASGLSLNWDHCAADGRAFNKTSACTSNVGSAGTIVASFSVSDDVLAVGGLEVFVDIVSAGTVLPAWWESSCRSPFSLNAVIEPTALNCQDWSSAAANGALAAYSSSSNTPNAARMLAGFAIVPAGTVDVRALPADGSEYFAFNIVLSNAKSSGTQGAGSCAGCETPALVAFNGVRMFSGPSTVAIFGSPTSPGSNIVTWQGGLGGPEPFSYSCQFTPTRKSTWGLVKTLYR